MLQTTRRRAARPGWRSPSPGAVGRFALLVGINALVGAMLGQERSVVPLLATRTFHLRAYSAALSFILAFGLAKALTNLVAGSAADRLGRRPVLIAGWLAGLPVPMILMLAPSWGWVVAANVLLGVNQGLAWSATLVMKVDLVGPHRRGFAIGMNEFAGYTSLAGAALGTGWIAERAGLRPEPFFLGLAVAGLGLALSTISTEETRPPPVRSDGDPPALWDVFLDTSFRRSALAACTQAGLVNNLNDAVAWGIVPLLLVGGASVGVIGSIVAVYPAVWGIGQLVTGTLSDRVGRKPLIVAGMATQAGALAVLAGTHSLGAWVLGMSVLGIGTALVYPTLAAAVLDHAAEGRRASSLGVYRAWRDLGFAVGALVAGFVADVAGPRSAIGAAAILTALSGLVVAIAFAERRP